MNKITAKPFRNEEKNFTFGFFAIRDERTFISAESSTTPEYTDWEIRLKSGRDTDNPVWSRFRILDTKEVVPKINTILVKSPLNFFITLNRHYDYQMRFKVNGGQFSEWQNIDLVSGIRILGPRHTDIYDITRENGKSKTKHLNPQFKRTRKNGKTKITKNLNAARGKRNF